MNPDETIAEIGDVVFEWIFILRDETRYTSGLLFYPVIDIDDALFYISEYNYDYIHSEPRAIRRIHVTEDEFLLKVCQFDQSLNTWRGELS